MTEGTVTTGAPAIGEAPETPDENVIALNPSTGVLEAFTPDAAPVPPPNVPPLVRGVPLRFLQLEGEASGPDTCETTINLKGLVCNVDLMSLDKIKEFEAQEQAFSTMPLNEQISARRAAYDQVESRYLKGFNGTKLQPGQRFRNIAVQASFVIQLLQKSQTGSCESDFDIPENFSAGS